MYCVVAVFGNAPNGNRMYLTDRSPTQDNPIVVDQQPSPNTFAENQLWIPIYRNDFVFSNRSSFCLRNKSTGNLISYSGPGSAVTIVADSASIENELNVQLNPVVPADASGIISALRTWATGDFTMNLNVSGGTNQNPPINVIFNKWGGGQDNELWSIYYVDGVTGGIS